MNEPLPHLADASTCDTDNAALDRLRRFGGARLLRGMVSLFLDALPERIGAARRATERGDAVAAEQALHALKSSSAQLGAMRMHRLCAESEALARSGSLGAVLPLVELIEREEPVVRRWLSVHRDETDA